MPETTTKRKAGLASAFLGTNDEQRISAAIQTAEQRTSGEIVAVVAAESDSYLWAPLLVAALTALAIAGPLIFFTWINVHWIYLLQLLVFAVLALVLMLRPLRTMLVPRSIKRARAHGRAVEQFLVQNLHTTNGRTGILIFVSVAERYAEILADAGIHKKVDRQVWQGIVDTLTKDISEGQTGDAFVNAIAKAGDVLAQHFPPGTADVHAMPNHLIVLG
jgi:putative membrane protein